jgi:hypothetical protein
MRLAIGLLRCPHCAEKALAVVTDGKLELISQKHQHDAWEIEKTFAVELPAELTIGEECPVHHYAKHGKEAEELRQGIDKILMSGLGCFDRDCDQYPDALRELLDKVDARDSLAYLERSET